MVFREIKTRSFKLKGEAIAWAKKQKQSAGGGEEVKWETNRTQNSERPWEAVIYRDIT